MKEIWKSIAGYEGLYEISNFGNVRTPDKFIKRRNGTTYFLKGRVMKLNLAGASGKQYLCVDLFKDGVRNHRTIHRLVAETFLPNPQNLPCVNHINETKTDNRAENLEWCSYSYNNTYKDAALLRNRKRSKAVSQFTKGGVFVQKFSSIKEASIKTGLDCSSISSSCKKTYRDWYKARATSGFKWRFSNE